MSNLAPHAVLTAAANRFDANLAVVVREMRLAGESFRQFIADDSDNELLKMANAIEVGRQRTGMQLRRIAEYLCGIEERN